MDAKTNKPRAVLGSVNGGSNYIYAYVETAL